MENEKHTEWVNCSEDNYWEDDENGFTVVCVSNLVYEVSTCICNKEYWSYTQANCPYGWNVLTEMGAKMKYVEFPNDCKNEKKIY